MTALINLPGFRFGTLRLPYQTVDETRKRFENAGPGQVNLVAELDDRIVGDAGMMRYLGRRSHAASIGMGVHDDFTGKGIGSAYGVISPIAQARSASFPIGPMSVTQSADRSCHIQHASRQI
ncbi:N-acetyltransferase family protein [Rhizobium mongolense]|uniref:GNAT family N-acetyltransferase n=1 Tax=Rhizobium mongolense TaxID=57676 RepID=UPI0035580F72